MSAKGKRTKFRRFEKRIWKTNLYQRKEFVDDVEIEEALPSLADTVGL